MSINISPIRISKLNLIKSDTMPVLNILEIQTIFEEYTIAIGVVDESLLDIELAKPTAII